MVQEIFPTLVDIATRMLQTPPSSAQEIPTMLHLILKTYKTSILIFLSPHQQSAESLVPWGRLLFAVVNLQIPPEAVPEDEDERERSEWWKAKKWAYGVLGTLFHRYPSFYRFVPFVTCSLNTLSFRYGNPSQLPSTMQKEYGAFAQHFVTMFAPEILGTYLRQVELYVSGQTWLSKKSQYQIFKFFTEWYVHSTITVLLSSLIYIRGMSSVKPKSTWTLLKPHFETLVSTFVFPQLSFTSVKQALWENDPVDYVRVSVGGTLFFFKRPPFTLT